MNSRSSCGAFTLPSFGPVLFSLRKRDFLLAGRPVSQFSQWFKLLSVVRGGGCGQMNFRRVSTTDQNPAQHERDAESALFEFAGAPGSGEFRVTLSQPRRTRVIELTSEGKVWSFGSHVDVVSSKDVFVRGEKGCFDFQAWVAGRPISLKWPQSLWLNSATVWNEQRRISPLFL